MSALLDTHTVLWYLEDSKELSAHARTTIEEAIQNGRYVYVWAISVIEAVYLVERNKIPAAALRRLRDAAVRFGFAMPVLPSCPPPFLRGLCGEVLFLILILVLTFDSAFGFLRDSMPPW